MMHSHQTQKLLLEEAELSVKLKLSALWVSFMFLYIYVDYFHLYMPGSLGDIMARKMFVFEITPLVLMVGLVSVTIPALMIFLSIVVSAKVNRCANLVVAAVYIPYTLFNLAGEAWVHMFFGAFVEIILLLLILFYAWKWPTESV